MSNILTVIVVVIALLVITALFCIFVSPELGEALVIGSYVLGTGIVKLVKLIKKKLCSAISLLKNRKRKVVNKGKHMKL